MPRNDQRNDFVTKAHTARVGFIPEFAAFMMQNKKWWITPIVLCILGLGLLVIFGGTGAAPFIYTFF